jgi:hypothetical protein
VFVNGKSIQNGQLFVGETREPTLEGKHTKVLLLVRHRLPSQTLDCSEGLSGEYTLGYLRVMTVTKRKKVL